MRKFALRLAGWSFTLACLLFFAIQVRHHWSSILLHSKGKILIYIVLPASAFYAVTCFLLSLSWFYLARGVGSTLTLHKVHKIYAKSQIAKYIPGNIFHYGSRQVLGHREGMSHTTVFLVNLLETTVIIGAAAGVSLIGGVGLVGIQWGVRSVVGAIIGSIFISGFLVMFLPRFAFRLSGMRDMDEDRDHILSKPVYLIPPIFAYMTFFAMMGLLIWILALVCTSGAVTIKDLPLFLSVYATAWLGGFITPGAPGGIGVRETLLSAGLSPNIGIPNALTLSLTLRVITIIGDGFFYFTSYLKPDQGVEH